MSSAQLSMSMARTNAASTVAARTNHAADSPSAVACDTGNEERGHAKLRDRERGGLAH